MTGKKGHDAPMVPYATATTTGPQGHAGAFAALDLGTNNCRLLVGTPANDGFRVVDSFSRIVRLGEGLHHSGALSGEAMERAMGALHACAARLRRRPVRAVRAIATEACRRAANGPAFLARVHAETGINFDIISTREEAELALESCATLLAGPGRRALLFDIGGGSTELAWVRLDGSHGPTLNSPDLKSPTLNGHALHGPTLNGPTLDGPALNGHALNGHTLNGHALSGPTLIGYDSLPVGVVTLAERFGHQGFSDAGYRAMVDHVSTLLAPFERIHCIAHEVRLSGVRLLGTSGTVTTLAGVALGLARYRRPAVDGLTLSAEAIDAALAMLRGLGREGLARHPCVGPERTAFVLPGCAIFEAIRNTWRMQAVTVADRGLREGMLLRMMRASATRPVGVPREQGRKAKALLF